MYVPSVFPQKLKSSKDQLDSYSDLLNIVSKHVSYLRSSPLKRPSQSFSRVSSITYHLRSNGSLLSLPTDPSPLSCFSMTPNFLLSRVTQIQVTLGHVRQTLYPSELTLRPLEPKIGPPILGIPKNKENSREFERRGVSPLLLLPYLYPSPTSVPSENPPSVTLSGPFFTQPELPSGPRTLFSRPRSL